MQFTYVLPGWEASAADGRILHSVMIRENGLKVNKEKAEEYFNMKHSSARNVIERCFEVLKKRWAILKSPSFYPIRMQNKIILACCLLHNFIRKELTYDPFENEETYDTNNDEDDEDLQSEVWNHKSITKGVLGRTKENNGFKPRFLIAVEHRLAVLLPDSAWNGTNGFGWDYVNNMLEAPQPVWK
nr:hypothetical protein [Tanacetum cinerariifolium]